MARFQAQPKGLGPFFRLAALSVAYLEQPNRVPSALPDGKMSSSGGGDETATDPSK
ncbi:hypothetical protein [uncultured Zhongshania sp.]|uniref:hypothetical protein n=1 Tax=uncultured Zhongshania sp. TaxID=1642288 RepID=UPI0030DD086D